MNHELYPLKFDPIYQYRIWGGRRLSQLLSKPLPAGERVGEAWLLSDRKEHPSEVKEGPLKGATIKELMDQFPRELMGKIGSNFNRFPLLLKFLDCNALLSVQVHPSDHQKEYIPKGNSGKTEAWVVLEAAADSRIYAGLKPGTTKENLLKSIQDKSVADRLHSFAPKKGDAVFIQSGTVHTLGGAVVFEVQENSDVTFRLYDWDRKDPKTGKQRDLQVKEAVASIDFNQVNIEPVTPKPDSKNKNTQKLFDNAHFILWRIEDDSDFTVGFEDEPAILVCTEGEGRVKYNNSNYAIRKGEVMLLPAIAGPLLLHTEKDITLLQIAIPSNNKQK